MRIRLENIRCFERADIDLGEGGTVLLSGPSGSGKTTVHDAIHYAICGGRDSGGLVRRTGANEKLAASSCAPSSIQLVVKSWTVTRTLTPVKSVRLEGPASDTLEGPDAEAGIARVFGGGLMNMLRVQQGGAGSFLSKSASEKRDVLEEALFQDVEISRLRSLCSSSYTEAVARTRDARVDLSRVRASRPVGDAPTDLAEAERAETQAGCPQRALEDCEVAIADVQQARAAAESARVAVRQARALERAASEKKGDTETLRMEVASKSAALDMALAVRNRALLCRGDEDKERCTRCHIGHLRDLGGEFGVECGKGDGGGKCGGVGECGGGGKCGGGDGGGGGDSRDDCPGNPDLAVKTLCEIREARDLMRGAEARVSAASMRLRDFDDLEDGAFDEPVTRRSQSERDATSSLRERLRKALQFRRQIDRASAKLEALGSPSREDFEEVFAQKRRRLEEEHVDVFRCPACSAHVELKEDEDRSVRLVASLHAREIRRNTASEFTKQLKCAEAEVCDARGRSHERLRLQAELSASEAQLRLVADGSVGGLSSADIEAMLKSEDGAAAADERDDTLLAERSRAASLRADSMARIREELASSEKDVQRARETLSRAPRWTLSLEHQVDVELTLAAESRRRAASAQGALSRAEEDVLVKAEDLRRVGARARDAGSVEVMDMEASKARASAEASEVELALAERSLEVAHEEERRLRTRADFSSWLHAVDGARRALLEACDAEWGLSCLRSVVEKCELQCFRDITATVNVHLAAFARIMFEDDPIEVSLQTERSLAKAGQTKDEVCVCIAREGARFKPTSLSGGELARVNACLAFALSAVASTGTFVVLDEVTASLDAEATGRLVEAAILAFPNRLLLFICHQVTSGLFDRVVTL